ncbi:MAG: 16S rRNA (guanine(527)-N(7))-methyltransferase RsmG [Dehalococcoidia bacterium]
MRTLARSAQQLNLPLTDAQLRQFWTYSQEVRANADRAGLTAITDAEEIQRRHFLESLALLAVLERCQALGQRAVDIGSGAGFPGLPIKLMRPELQLTLVESTRKKAEFLAHLVRRLGLAEVLVMASRAEDLAHDPSHREAYDLALARALAPLPVLVELALPFLRLGGWLASPKGSKAIHEVEAAGKALELCGGRVEAVERLDVPGGEKAPTLVLVRKLTATPDRFPRRAGIPAKRPLR